MGNNKIGRIHTSEHILWQVMKARYPNLKTAGLELSKDKTRIDYKCDEDLTKIDVTELETEVNAIIAKNLPVSFETLPREEAAKKADLSLVPENIKEVRLVKIGDFSCEACVGLHAANTNQIGKIKIIEIKKIGKDAYRIYVRLEETMNKTQSKIVKESPIPQTPKGFRDFYGPEMRLRRQVVSAFQSVFESYGYEPLETPAMEYAETLLGKYGEEAEKLVYQLEDMGGRKMALMYEMTASACRFVAQNKDKLVFPFKRYQIQKAWRAEKPQKGRYREFMQCDADIWGTTSVTIDAEFIEMATVLMQKLGFKDFFTKINNRKIINAIAKYAGASEEQFYDITVSVDKLAKIGMEGVQEELAQRKIPEDISEKVLAIVNLKGDNREILTQIKSILKDFSAGLEGVCELQQIFDILNESGFENKLFRYDPSIVRGLAYYTGPVWEIEVVEGGVGSVAGCGRYDTLTKMLSGVDIPASGGSFGVERICEVLKDRNMVTVPTSITKLLVTVFLPELAPKSREIGRQIRSNGINTEVFIDPQTKLDRQLKYADKKGIPFVVIIGPNEITKGTVQLKNLQTKGQKEIKESDLISLLK